MAESTEETPDKETDPALPSRQTQQSADQIAKVIGNVGRWQVEKILLVFLASAPGKTETIQILNKSNYYFVCILTIPSGLSHIFHASFITPKQKFWCGEVVEEGETVPPPWTVHYNHSDILVWPGDTGDLTWIIICNYLTQATPLRTRRCWVTVCPAVSTTSLTRSSGCPPW